MFPFTARTKNDRLFMIRPGDVLDQERIIANINAVAAEEIYLQTECFVLTPNWEDLLYDSLNPHKGQLLILPIIDEQAIGHLRLHSGSYGEKDRHVGSIGLALLAPYRGLGIGTVLLNCALKWSRVAGFEKLEAYVIASNVRARRFFEKFGFVVEGIRQRQLKIRGQYEDELILARSTVSFQ